MPDGSAIYCRLTTVNHVSDLPRGLNIISQVGISLSILSLLILILTYIMFPKIRNISGKSVLSLSLSLLVVFILTHLNAITVQGNTFCKTIAATSHYFWLSSFFWMNVLAIDLCRTFGSRAKIRVNLPSTGHFVWYSLYAWGAPAVIVGICLTIDFCQCTGFTFGYGKNGICWLTRGNASLYGFGVPLACLLFINIILFADTIRGIRITKKSSEMVRKDRPVITQAKEDLFLYIKLSCIMGFTWALAFVCDYGKVRELWYVFTAVNSLQGVMLLLVFGFSKRNIALWREKIGKAKEETRRLSGQGEGNARTTHNTAESGV
ncbi:adhesion G protein-coupled receptor E2-like [Diadema antillarum]|uniref:adhesion G protein-coupled receptor E2-like n=1 Tax=Diadema antillarum TaxID=105358 RepID=UPI003A89174F